MDKILKCVYLIKESEIEEQYLKKGDKVYNMPAINASCEYWFFAIKLLKVLEIKDILILQEIAGKENIDIGRFKSKTEPYYSCENPLINEIGFNKILDHYELELV